MAAGAIVIAIAKEDDIIAEGKASIVTAKFGPRTTKQPRQSSDLLAIAGDLIDKRFRDLAACALFVNVCGYLSDVAARGSQIDENRHLMTGRNAETLASEAPDFFGCEASAFAFGCL